MYMFVPGVCAPVRLPARSEFNRHRKSPRAARPGDFFHLLAPSRRSAFFPDASSGGKGGTLARFPAGSGRRAVPNAVLDRPAVLSHDPAEGFASRYGIHGDAIGRSDRRGSFPAVRRRSRSAASRIPGAPDRGRQLTEDPRPAAARGTLQEGGVPPFLVSASGGKCWIVFSAAYTSEEDPLTKRMSQTRLRRGQAPGRSDDGPSNGRPLRSSSPERSPMHSGENFIGTAARPRQAAPGS